MVAEEGWKISDFVYGLIVPCIVALVIMLIPVYVGPALTAYSPLDYIFTIGFAEALLTIAIPLLFGLLWNQWAGGCSGFLLGSIYYLAISTYYGMAGDLGLIGYVVTAMFIGYTAGALNKKSQSFMRMLISSLIAGIIAGILQFYFYGFSTSPMATGLYGFAITLTPKIIYAIIVPVIAKVFIWYNVLPRRPA